MYHMRLTRTLFIILSLFLPPLLFSNIPWRQKSSFQFVKEISLPELIRGYFALQGINVVIDPDVTGSVNGKFEDLSPEEFLNRLSRSYGLIWFYDGNVIYVYPSQKVESRSVEINELGSKKLLETIGGLGMVAPSSSIRLVGPNNIAFVSGPPKYVNIVADIADRLSKTLQKDYNDIFKVRVFPLQHAWAYDTSFTTQETRITLPGLASVLRGLMEPGMEIDTANIISGPIKKDRIQVAHKINTFLQENGLSREHNKEILAVNDYNPAILPSPPPLVSPAGTLIQPDIRLNAIIVRDVEAKFPQYEAIIKALDVPVYLIEISVAIIDINTTFTSAIGNSRFNATRIGDGRQFVNITPATNNPAGTPFNIQLGAIWDGYQILSQIEALSSEGYSNILARPTVLTLNNLEAEISSSKTFYIQLLGKDASDLASVTTQTSLKVTPRVLEEEDGTKRIKLLVNIEDGNFDNGGSTTVTSGTTSALPITSNNIINTQAVVIEGQSLLIGGLYRTQKDASESGIPILKDIPWLGYFFKVRTKNEITLERMYLITPRIIYLDYEKPPHVENQICSMPPPPMGIAHEMSKENYECTHDCPYAQGFDCGKPLIYPCPETCKVRTYGKIRRYFDE